jgi:hypothetical protein
VYNITYKTVFQIWRNEKYEMNCCVIHTYNTPKQNTEIASNTSAKEIYPKTKLGEIDTNTKRNRNIIHIIPHNKTQREIQIQSVIEI